MDAATPATSNHRLPFHFAALLWAGLSLFGAFYGAWLGLGGRRFAVAIAVTAALLAGQLLPAARGVAEWIIRWLGERLALLVPLFPLTLYFLYAVGTGTLSARSAALAAAYVLVPSLLVIGSRANPDPAWQDYLAMVAIWLPVGFHWLYSLFPYPQPLTHTLSILFALNTGLGAFLFIRRLGGIGYSIEWGRRFALYYGVNLGIFALIAIPLGLQLRFLTFVPSLDRLRMLPLAAIAIPFFTAWPEEFLFRGILQNMLSRTLHNPWTGLAVASVLFGLSHIYNGTFPNWRYAILATIAGVCYGRAWMKSKSLFPACLVHASVDVFWHLLFR
jgi:membrane protease YdiL (CAAX protease family)